MNRWTLKIDKLMSSSPSRTQLVPYLNLLELHEPGPESCVERVVQALLNRPGGERNGGSATSVRQERARMHITERTHTHAFPQTTFFIVSKSILVIGASFVRQ